ncbi:hypothetical protein Moror_4072 [Moniliophthora roreri MCA 2997]|uniref:Uncharacterized protein n=1 Tax=Moniliophthora roreri (strain MCA 2997) TaxID=1381753 RepID=V2YGE3_MONRO|nr:hypothetical protein Moror_4072 [Moniliophthora roreri MCA 2997]
MASPTSDMQDPELEYLVSLRYIMTNHHFPYVNLSNTGGITAKYLHRSCSFLWLVTPLLQQIDPATVGPYIVLFGYSIHFLHRRAPSCHSLHKAGITVFSVLAILGVISTTDSVHESEIEFRIRKQDFPGLEDYAQDDTLVKFHIPFRYLLSILANLTTDSVLIHRCYAVWGSRK